jgi:cytidine deaminase
MWRVFLPASVNYPTEILAKGQNYYLPSMKTHNSIHAEHDAINNLPALPKNKKLKKVELLVIRSSKTGVLGMSKPCEHCLQIIKLASDKGYYINKVYYSTIDGNIDKSSVDELLENPYKSSFYRYKLR